MSNKAWNTMVISTPNGDYTPNPEGLVQDEMRKAALKAGLTSFYGFINGDQIVPSDVAGKKIKDLTDLPRIEGTVPLAVRPYNKAG